MMAWWPLWVVKFDFPLLLWLIFLQHLGNHSNMFCGGVFHLFCLFFFFSLKGMITIYLWQLVPESQLCFEFFSNIRPRYFLRAVITNRIPGLVNWGSFRTCDQILFTENIHEAAALFNAHLWFLGVTRALGKVCFLGSEIEWNVPEQTQKTLSVRTFSSKASHKHPVQAHPFRVHSTLLRVLGC